MTRFALALALSRCAGLAMTCELAAQVLAEVFPPEDRSFPIAELPTGSWGAYTFQPERVAGNEAELLPLHTAYHLETRGALADEPDYDFARLCEDERAGTVVMFTVRHGAELVGLMRTRIGRTLESQRVTAYDDMLIIKSAHRGTMLPIRLCGYVERTLFGAGVQEISVDTLTINGAETIARFFGFTQVAIRFRKVAQDASDYSTVPTRHNQGVAHEPLASH